MYIKPFKQKMFHDNFDEKQLFAPYLSTAENFTQLRSSESNFTVGSSVLYKQISSLCRYLTSNYAGREVYAVFT